MGYLNSDKKFVRAYNEHYFMTDTEVFVLFHYPTDDVWQLVDQKYVLEEYENWAKFLMTRLFLDLEYQASEID